ncbi:MAG TPA: NAD-dependent epimerase/dehydratase family protein [Candidatus Sulfotelmatobacter sp.]|nr:NAD-dependent epimerase/dehydratase family protein [Candidatus Sulfotelmatobacter sp.]
MILVTGATGFLGRHLVRRLLGAGEAVRCFVRPGSPGLEWLQSQPVEIAVGHLLDAASLGRACDGVDHILHLAAPTREARDAVVEQTHRQGTALLAEAARANRVDRLIMLSPLGSAASAGLLFLRSRGQAEEQLRQMGLPTVILQTSLMFGSGDRLISGTIRMLRRTGILLIPGTGKTMLQPIWVGDVVSALLRALRDDTVLGRTIPIGGPQHLTYEEIADQVGKMLNVPRVKVHLSRRAVAWVSRLLEGLGLNPFLGYRHLELLEVGTITALDAVRRSFGFQPMPLIEGVAYHIVPRREMGASGPPSGVVRGSRSRERQ